MKGKIRFLGLVMVLAMAAAIVVTSAPSWAQKGKPQPPVPPGDPAIVYYAYQAWGHTDIKVMDASGANQKVIVEGIKAGYGNFDPSWAPDNTWIVFGRTDGGISPSNGIFKVKKDGTGLCRVTTMVQVPWASFGFTEWRPFVPEEDGVLPLLYTDSLAPALFMVDDACPSPPMGLTSIPPCNFSRTAWSRDGKKLAAAVQDITDPYNSIDRLVIFRLELSSTGWTLVLENDLKSTGPLAGADIYSLDWANTTNKLAVGAYAIGGNHDIWIIDLDGDVFQPVNITATTDASEVEPSWSPDDSLIVYSRNGFIYKMKADGTERVQLAAPGRRQQLRGPDWKY
jgi:Tol biopolymer transport system component